MRTVLLAALLLPATALARDCEHREERQLDLDFNGIRHLVVDVGANELTLEAAADGDGKLQALACASTPEHLTELQLKAERQGDTLNLRVEGGSLNVQLSLFGFEHRRYAWLRMQARIPEGIAVRTRVGSGEASLQGIESLDVELGSGEVEITDSGNVALRVGSGDALLRDLRGPLRMRVGSGDVTLDGAASLDVDSIGSGDLDARRINGEVRVASIGSGDFELREAGGPVWIGSIGSGDARIERAQGNVVVDRVGSGDLIVREAGGLQVLDKGSGSIAHRYIEGAVELPSKD
ncbi:MAG TPA: DUF4097 family beta strand repeat-containing protein [Arenimonas sp.]|nr:DUF4097 family beta strand repeat-containing protein [Arenimonas sp.]